MPSETVAPTEVDTVPQQGGHLQNLALMSPTSLMVFAGSTMPGDGSEVHVTGHVGSQDPNVNVVEVPTEKVPWKDQVLGMQSCPQSNQYTVFLHFTK